jgi:histidinol dehydrogenase
MRVAVEGRISELTPEQRALLLERAPVEAEGLRRQVESLLEEVRRRGDSTLRDMALRYDGVQLTSLEVPRELWSEALDRLPGDVRQGLRVAANHIAAFHRAQIPADVEVETSPGVTVGRRALPVRSAGVYAPGGRAAYPSSVLMGVVPAVAAGVPNVLVCSPPGPSGTPPNEVMAAAAIAGASRLFALGGAGAVAALAFGTESIPRVDVIVGPGNRWVTEAKRQVAGDVRIDSPAGPSEVLVVAEESADPRRVALELVAQAEHDPDAAVCAVTTSAAHASAVRSALEEVVVEAPRREVVEAALSARGALLIATDLDEALAFADDYAPEHLALFTSDPENHMTRVPAAATVFLGEHAAVAFGDYITGANHVLPTGGRARSFSGLSTLDFLRFVTYQRLTAEGAATLSETVAVLARAEGLPGHGAAALARSDA